MSTFFSWTLKAGLAVVGLAALFVLGSLLPIEGNYSFRIVESGSMEPAIKTGSIVATIPRAGYRIGDVVTFAGTDINPQPTTHRIVGAEMQNGAVVFTTKGDANEDADYRRVWEEEILGKVFLDVPYAGYLAQYLRTPNGRSVFAAGIGVLIVLMFMPWKKLKKQSNENL